MWACVQVLCDLVLRTVCDVCVLCKLIPKSYILYTVQRCSLSFESYIQCEYRVQSVSQDWSRVCQMCVRVCVFGANVRGSVPDLKEAVPGSGAHRHAIIRHTKTAHAIVMAGQDSYRRQNKRSLVTVKCFAPQTALKV